VNQTNNGRIAMRVEKKPGATAPGFTLTLSHQAALNRHRVS
jgi:hypothetical protein